MDVLIATGVVRCIIGGVIFVACASNVDHTNGLVHGLLSAGVIGGWLSFVVMLAPTIWVRLRQRKPGDGCSNDRA